MKLRNLFALLLVMAAVLSCQTPTKVMNIKHVDKVDDEAILFALPQTVVRVEVEVTKEIVRRGPYFNYAEKYLGIKDVPTEDSYRWYISDIRLSTYEKPDTNHFYLANLNEKAEEQFAGLAEKGHVMSYYFLDQLGSHQIEQGNLFLNEQDSESVIYTDLSVREYLTEVIEPVRQRVQREDTSFIRITEYTKSVLEKSPEKKAQEASSFIIKLRNRQFKLLAGAVNKAQFPDSESVKYMNEELQRIEEEYIELFTGKTINQTKTYYFDLTPTPRDLSKKVLFYFSETIGMSLNSYGGFPVSIEIMRVGDTQVLNRLYMHPENNTVEKNSLVYRIPDDAIIKVMDGNDVIAIKRVAINQFGTIITMPVR